MPEIYLEYNWNIPYFSYTRYIPVIYRSYELNGHMTGIYLVYTQDFRFLGIPDVELELEGPTATQVKAKQKTFLAAP